MAAGGFGCVVSIIQAPHNLHNYDELQLPARHRPFNDDGVDQYLTALYPELRELLNRNVRVVVHGDDLVAHL